MSRLRIVLVAMLVQVAVSQAGPVEPIPLTAETGAVAGRILDIDGEPAARTIVQALRIVYLDGKRDVTLAQSVASDDRGRFRLFWLAPGHYLVNALMPPNTSTSTEANLLRTGGDSISFFVNAPDRPLVIQPSLNPANILVNGESLLRLPTFYPDTIDMQTAVVIEIKAGSDVAGIDFALSPPVRPHAVRGSVSDPEKHQHLTAGIRIVRSASGRPAATAIATDSAAMFQFAPSLAPGAYTVIADAMTDAGYLFGSAPVIIGDSDINDLVINVAPQVAIAGRVTVEEGVPGGKMQQALDPHVLLDPYPSGSGLTQAPGFLEDGKFTIERAPPGHYRILLPPLLTAAAAAAARAETFKDAYIKAIRVGGRDLPDGIIPIEPYSNGDIEIVIASDGAAIDGHAVDQAGHSASRALVVLVPDSAHRLRLDLFRTAVSDAAGAFHISAIAPGDYTLLSWSAVDDGAWQNEEFLGKFTGRGKPVHVEANTRTIADAIVLPEDVTP